MLNRVLYFQRADPASDYVAKNVLVLWLMGSAFIGEPEVVTSNTDLVFAIVAGVSVGLGGKAFSESAAAGTRLGAGLEVRFRAWMSNSASLSIGTGFLFLFLTPKITQSDGSIDYDNSYRGVGLTVVALSL